LEEHRLIGSEPHLVTVPSDSITLKLPPFNTLPPLLLALPASVESVTDRKPDFKAEPTENKSGNGEQGAIFEYAREPGS
jgi:hypothetical protein